MEIKGRHLPLSHIGQQHRVICVWFFFSKYSKRRGNISRQNCPLNILLFTQDRDGFLKHVPNVIT